ncbi:hypothetical protein AV530_016148 [Patagioenas fasciata monilis]|uniref:Uncharacterized protein n=1 Tax=Patagioenas fasciata monilis TaxID=372326 RepID=A0A1V4JW87_PATFA|nr:hypothetical protein AV530_016148 [Patagioenas fasciata monilis]
MASPAPPAPPGAPGAGGSEGTEDALGVAVAKGRQPPVSALSAFSYIPARREGPPELSYFHRVGKQHLSSVLRQEMFPLMMPFLVDQRVTTKNFTDVTEDMQAVVVLTLTRRKWQDLSLFCHLQNMGDAYISP